MNWYRIMKIANRKSVSLLVGPPAIGKSTWIKNNKPNAFVISKDDIRNAVAPKYNFTYDEVFKTPDESLPVGHVDPKYGEVVLKPEDAPDYFPDTLYSKVREANDEINVAFDQQFIDAINSGKDIVIDMTNVSAGNRKEMLDKFGDAIQGYEKNVVNFNFQGEDVQEAIVDIANERARQIEEQGGKKTIGPEVFQNMYERYEEPTVEEGFDNIIQVDDRKRLLQQALEYRKRNELV
jgi:tRNA uridine 5-carbamoylmethylation protein Kti12